jgi:hypothetical protein
MKDKIDFDELTFEKFRDLAKLDSLSYHEKVGFPNDYREGKERAIFDDMLQKITPQNLKESKVIEIGPGCSQLPVYLADLCDASGSHVYFIDSEEMLNLLPNAPHIIKLSGCYPSIEKLNSLYGKVNLIVAYSVIQYVFAEGNLWDFIDKSLMLLKEGGEIFLGDIPNITMRKRFFASKEGAKTHQEYTGSSELPKVHFNNIEHSKIDDSVVMSILMRARAEGFHAWVLPQSNDLPMANRREDILIRRP